MPVIAFLRLVHFRIALAVLVLRRWRRSDQRCIDDRMFVHRQVFFGQMPIDRLEDLALEAIGFETVAELQQGCGIRRRLAHKSNADKSTDRLAIIDRFFAAFIRQAKALLSHVHKQHARHTNRWAARSVDLRVKQFDKLMQLPPRGQVVDLRQEAVATRQLFLGGVLEVGKLFCMIDGGLWGGRYCLRSSQRRGRD